MAPIFLFRIFTTFVNEITPIKTDTKPPQRTDKDGNPYTVTTITKKAKYRFSIRINWSIKMALY